MKPSVIYRCDHFGHTQWVLRERSGEHQYLSGATNERDSKPRLMIQVRNALVVRHYSPRTTDTYTSWVKRFIYFHGVRHPDTMGTHAQDLADGWGRGLLPNALDRKLPNAPREWVHSWQHERNKRRVTKWDLTTSIWMPGPAS